tara:strand:- start:1010 stop:1489 length:480 start_codon:yes stop_codon:yes gene_type:complete
MNGQLKTYTRGILNQTQYKKDMKFGFSAEISVLQKLKEKYGNNIKKYEDFYSKMDYYLVNDNGDVIRNFELKSRRVKFGQYPSLCFNGSKFVSMKDNLNKYAIPTTILFNLTNGLYMWDYTTKTKTSEYFIGEIANCKRNDKKMDAVFVYNKYILPFLP